MHGVSPPISKNSAFRILIAGAPGDGCSTLSAQLKDAAVATVSRAIDAGTSGDAGGLGHAHSFAIGQRAFIFERLIGVTPWNETTGACDYEIAVIVVDAQRGLTPETKRQIVIASTLGVRHLVIAVNKLDLIGWDRKAYESVAAAFATFAANLRFTSELPIPVSALLGDNIAAASAHMPWYKGPSLMSYLERLERTKFGQGRGKGPLRLPIAAVLRPDPDHRRYRGTIASGQLHRGDKAQVAVSGVTSTIERIFFDEIESEMAHAGESVSIELSSHIDVGRGDMLVHPAQRPHIADQFAAQVLWMSSEPLLPGRDYTLKVGTKELTASVTVIKYRLDFETLHQEAARTLQQGEVGACTIAATEPLALDAFGEVPQTGKFALLDRYTGREIATGMIDFILRRGENIHPHPLAVSKKKRALLKAQKPCILWFTGLSGAGKSTIANLVEAQLARRGSHTYLLDGDNVRHGLNKNLGFTTADRVENIRRVGEVAKLFVDAGLIVLCSFISPFRAERETVRGLVEPAEFLEIFVRAPLVECERRDPKGLYAKSRAGELPNFTGIDSPYEEPESPDLVLDTTSAPAAELARRLVALLELRELIVAETPSIG